MLTELKAYSPWPSAPKLLLDPGGRPESDLLQIRNIEGLDPVKAAINTIPLAPVDGTAFTGAVLNTFRNIVLTIHPNPDWDEWNHDALRNLIYVYFAPKKPIDLVFHSDDILPVKISGYTEDVGLNPFAKDPEFQVSIVCPDPYFTSLNPVVIEGDFPYFLPPVIEYNGSVEVGFTVETTAQPGYGADAELHYMVQIPPIGGLRIQYGRLGNFTYGDGSHHHFSCFMSSVPGKKFVQQTDADTGNIENLLPAVQYGGTWPYLSPGPNTVDFSTYYPSSGGSGEFHSHYKLTYYAKYIGL